MTEPVHCNSAFVLSYVAGTGTVGIFYIIQNVTFYVGKRSDAVVVTYNRKDGVHFKGPYLYVTSITRKHGNLSR
jgi:hypothetical protein